ncbi:MAG: hypothetical protein ABIE36_02775 [Candidatus Diapherotrites archaeon]
MGSLFKRDYSKNHERYIKRREKLQKMDDNELSLGIKKYKIKGRSSLGLFSLGIGVMVASSILNEGNFHYKNESFKELNQEYFGTKKTLDYLMKETKNLEKSLKNYYVSNKEIEKLKEPLYLNLEKNKIAIKNLEEDVKIIEEEIKPFKKERGEQRKKSVPFYLGILAGLGIFIGGQKAIEFFEDRKKEYEEELKSRK